MFFKLNFNFNKKEANGVPSKIHCLFVILAVRKHDIVAFNWWGGVAVQTLSTES